MSKIYYHQAADVYCMASHILLTGFYQLGHEVQSNILNYPFIKPIDNPDLRLSGTSGNMKADYTPCDAFIDGRDQEDMQQEYMGGIYFKSNGAGGIKLPACTMPERYVSPEAPRSNKIVFLAGHTDFGREYLKDIIEASFIDGDNRPLVPQYPAESCNMYSAKYYDALADAKISVNAPGGSANTKKFQEIMASGCLTLNFIPPTYHQATPDVLDLIPPELNFPRHAVLNFHNKEEFDEIMKNPPVHLAWETFRWAQSWNPRTAATYVLNKIKELR